MIPSHFSSYWTNWHHTRIRGSKEPSVCGMLVLFGLASWHRIAQPDVAAARHLFANCDQAADWTVRAHWALQAVVRHSCHEPAGHDHSCRRQAWPRPLVPPRRDFDTGITAAMGRWPGCVRVVCPGLPEGWTHRPTSFMGAFTRAKGRDFFYFPSRSCPLLVQARHMLAGFVSPAGFRSLFLEPSFSLRTSPPVLALETWPALASLREDLPWVRPQADRVLLFWKYAPVLAGGALSCLAATSIIYPC